MTKIKLLALSLFAAYLLGVVVSQAPNGGVDCDLSELTVTANLIQGYVACDANCSGDADCDVTTGDTTWNDQIGAANNAVNVVAGKDPDYVDEATSAITTSCGHFDFDDIDQFRFSDVFGEDWTFAAIINVNVDSGNGTIVSGADNLVPQYRVNSNINQEFRGGGIAIIGASNTALTANTETYIVMRYDDAGDIDTAGTVVFWLNGTEDGQNTNAQDFTTALNTIGEFREIAGLDAQLVALLIYDDAKSDADIGTINTYLDTLCD